MQEIFYIPNSFNTAKSYHLLTNQAIFTMRYIKKYIGHLRKDKKGHTNKTSII